VAVGTPAPEILRLSADRACRLIVMSSHGLTGARKLFFGSTTERVLRETTVPVLVTPAHDPGPRPGEDAKHVLRRVLVPIDLSGGSTDQAQVARTIGETLDLPLILAHVIEPVRTHVAARLHLPGIQADHRARAEARLADLVAEWPPTLHTEALVVYGDPAEELAKVVHDREVGLIIVGLHGSPVLGPRMGSVTYRLLCLTKTVVLAMPPRSERASTAISETATVAATH
ncbi:MAG: universal stress protein, partial [Vicinamibacterales bacterium]